MGSRKFHEIWIAQCEAARDIKSRFGLQAAFDCVVAEKLLEFTCTAADHPEFAKELPRFVSEVRRMFAPDEMRTQIARVEREQHEKTARANAADDNDELLPESPAIVAAQARQFAIIQELLTAPELGPS
jgi:hypothetical protein